jgi:hypothetical protein
VSWQIASDEKLTQIVSRGTAVGRRREGLHGQGRCRRSSSRSLLLLRVHERRRAIADRTHEDASRPRQCAHADRVGVLLELPGRLLQRLSLSRQP